jgi:hypothetical protein
VAGSGIVLVVDLASLALLIPSITGVQLISVASQRFK